MSEIKIPFNANLIDLKQPPVVKIIETNGNYQLIIQVGLKKPKPTAINARNQSETVRLADVNLNIFGQGKAAIGLKKINASDASSKLTFVMDAIVKTKIPHTGDTYSEFDLKAVPAFIED